jgi:hypothetical protein
MFKYKSQEAIDKMTPEEADVYQTEKREHEAKAQADALAKALEPLQSELKTAKENSEQLALKVSELETKGLKSVEKTFLEEVLGQKEAIISMVKGGNNEEVVIKANTVRASIGSNTDAVKLSGIGQLGRKMRSLYDLFKKVNLSAGDHNGTVRYHDWDEATTVMAAAGVAEGGTFAESTAKFIEYKIDLVKIGDTLPVSEEFGTDEVSAAAELERFVDLNINSVIDTQVAVGSGAANNLKGLYTTAPAYTPVASGIADANIYDLAKKMRTAIVKNRGSKYSPNFVAMNSDVYDRLVLKKDANNNYIFPDRENIGSMVIVEDNNLADNTLVVGDSRYGEIYEMGGVALSRNYSGTQFVTDMITIKGRARLLFLIRNVDQTGFLKATNITTALATLATP